jgi:hypothetical protein
MLAGVEALKPTISHAMDQLISKKDRPIYSLFPGIPVLVKLDLNSLQGSGDKLLETIVTFVPVRVSLLDNTFILAYKFLSGGYGSSSQVYPRIHQRCGRQSYSCLLLGLGDLWVFDYMLEISDSLFN